MATVPNLLRTLSRHVPDAAPVGRNADDLPRAWQAIVVDDQKARVRAALSLWKPFAKELPAFSYVLADKLRDAACMRYVDEVRLVYQIEVQGEFHVFAGGAPRTAPPATWTPVHAELWASVDPRLRELYTTVHDGFTVVPEPIGGPAPFDDMSLDIVVAPSGPRPAIVIMRNGAGGELAVAAKAKRKPDGFVRLPDEEEVIEGGFWDLLDAWMAMTIAGEDED